MIYDFVSKDSFNESNNRPNLLGWGGIFLVFVGNIFYNFLYLAAKKGAEVIKRYRAYRLVVLKSIQKASTYTKGVDKLVC